MYRHFGGIGNSLLFQNAPRSSYGSSAETLSPATPEQPSQKPQLNDTQAREAAASLITKYGDNLLKRVGDETQATIDLKQWEEKYTKQLAWLKDDLKRIGDNPAQVEGHIRQIRELEQKIEEVRLRLILAQEIARTGKEGVIAQYEKVLKGNMDFYGRKIREIGPKVVTEAQKLLVAKDSTERAKISTAIAVFKKEQQRFEERFVLATNIYTDFQKKDKAGKIASIIQESEIPNLLLALGRKVKTPSGPTAPTATPAPAAAPAAAANQPSSGPAALLAAVPGGAPVADVLAPAPAAVGSRGIPAQPKKAPKAKRTLSEDPTKIPDAEAKAALDATDTLLKRKFGERHGIGERGLTMTDLLVAVGLDANLVLTDNPGNQRQFVAKIVVFQKLVGTKPDGRFGSDTYEAAKKYVEAKANKDKPEAQRIATALKLTTPAAAPTLAAAVPVAPAPSSAAEAPKAPEPIIEGKRISKLVEVTTSLTYTLGTAGTARNLPPKTIIAVLEASSIGQAQPVLIKNPDGSFTKGFVVKNMLASNTQISAEGLSLGDAVEIWKHPVAVKPA